MLDPTPKEEFFSRLGAIDEMATELAEEFDSVAAFLETPFEEKLSSIVGARQARKIAAKYQDFEHMRDTGKSQHFAAIDGVGGKSASRVSSAYIRRTIFVPRDVISAEELVRKMGFVTEQPSRRQRTLDQLVTDGGRCVETDAEPHEGLDRGWGVETDGSVGGSTGGTDRSPLTTAKMDSENDEYATPPKIWRPLARAVDGFDVDPASGAESTPIASTRFTKEDDELSKAWHGDVWLNPPWSTNGDGSAKETWLRKARNEANRDDVNRVVVVLPSDTSAHWFHDHVTRAESICFVGPGRIAFEGGDRNPSFGLIIAVFGPVYDELAGALDTLGIVVRGRSIYNPVPQTALPDGGECTLQTDTDRSEEIRTDGGVSSNETAQLDMIYAEFVDSAMRSEDPVTQIREIGDYRRIYSAAMYDPENEVVWRADIDVDEPKRLIEDEDQTTLVQIDGGCDAVSSGVKAGGHRGGEPDADN